MSGLLAKTVRDQRRALIGWGVGLAGVATMYSAFYPSVVKSASALSGYLQNMPEAFKNLIGGDFTSPAGYLRSETFSMLGPILFLVFAVGAGARAVAGEEEAGTLDLLLSTPVRRRQVLIDKFLAMALTTGALAGVLLVTLALVGPPFDLDIPFVDIGAACLMLFLLALAFGSIALAVGCATGHKGFAIGLTGAFAAAAFIVNALAPSVHALQPLRPLSPFRWYLQPDPLLKGVHVENVAVLLGLTAIAVAAAYVTFERRDLAA
jgi:beta-exotoxin I transport system permease protein